MFFLSYLNLCLFISKSISFIKSYFKPYWLFRRRRRNPQGLFEMSVLTAIQPLLLFFLVLWSLCQSSISGLPHASLRHMHPGVSLMCRLFTYASVTLCSVCICPSFLLTYEAADLPLVVWITQMSVRSSCGWLLHHIYVSDWLYVQKHANDTCLNPNSLTSSYIFAMMVLIVWTLTAPMADSRVHRST